MTARTPSAMKIARTTSCVTAKGASVCVGASAFSLRSHPFRNKRPGDFVDLAVRVVAGGGEKFFKLAEAFGEDLLLQLRKPFQGAGFLHVCVAKLSDVFREKPDDVRAEAASLNSALQAAADHHVTVVAAAGDTGAAGEPCSVAKALTGGGFPLVKEVNLPSSDPLVLAAGGTSLTASHTTGAYAGETAWGLPYGEQGTLFQATGGGFSRLFPRPGYQDGVAGIGAARGVPDVAADASGHSGMALAVSDGGGRYTIRNSGGTSASAPIWAALIALADQYAGRHLGFVNPAIYQIARGPGYQQAFHDITTGNNTAEFPPQTITGYQAAPGWDPVAGWGSPDAQVLVPLLARYAGA